MKKIFDGRHVLLALSAFSWFTMSCTKDLNHDTSNPAMLSAQASSTAQMLKDFTQTNLIGSNTEYQPVRVDPLLKNAWGISFSPTGTFWISSLGTGLSFVVNRDGGQVLAPVNIPSPGGPTGGHPTGQVFNSSTDFKLTNNNPARFIFCGVDGVISGWNGGATAERKINRVGQSVYTGLAIGNDGTGNFIYAADFKSGKVDVFNKDWVKVDRSFMDGGIPQGYSPFNIQALGNKLFVTYAEVGPDGFEVKHPGAGYVSIFNMDGSFDRRLASRGQLNAPWGIAKTPVGFYGSGSASTYLVGNFGDGRINAFSLDGEFIGQLRAHGNPIIIEGLWAISFPPATSTIDPNRLYFAAGPEDEQEGLFGYIKK